MRFSHTNIISEDWKKLTQFYTSIFECKIVPPVRKQEGEWLAKGTGVKNAELEGAHLKLPGYGENGPTLEIYQYTNVEKQSPVEVNKRGFGHIAFEVDDIEVMIRKVIDGGGIKCGELVTKEIAGAGIISFIYVRDPDGNLIELQNWER